MIKFHSQTVRVVSSHQLATRTASRCSKSSVGKEKMACTFYVWHSHCYGTVPGSFCNRYDEDRCEEAVFRFTVTMTQILCLQNTKQMFSPKTRPARHCNSHKICEFLASGTAQQYKDTSANRRPNVLPFGVLLWPRAEYSSRQLQPDIKRIRVFVCFGFFFLFSSSFFFFCVLNFRIVTPSSHIQ